MYRRKAGVEPHRLQSPDELIIESGKMSSPLGYLRFPPLPQLLILVLNEDEGVTFFCIAL